MDLIVQKFGGSSVRDAQHLRNVAAIIADTQRKGNALIVVLSAQGDTTDELLRKAHELSNKPSSRELDALLSTGEQVSVALCAILLEEMGLPAVSLSAWQVGIHTDEEHGDARIECIDHERIMRELAAGKIVLVAGFQGIDSMQNVTTLGRGGSDTSAVALAAAFGASRCEIYTDVDGVYTADPRVVPNARKYDVIDCDEMLQLARCGAQVLHSRSVELARSGGVHLWVLSSLACGDGTEVAVQHHIRLPHLAGVTRNGGTISVVGSGLVLMPDMQRRIRHTLEQSGIAVQSVAQGSMHISVHVAEEDAVKALLLIHAEFFES